MLMRTTLPPVFVKQRSPPLGMERGRFSSFWLLPPPLCEKLIFNEKSVKTRPTNLGENGTFGDHLLRNKSNRVTVLLGKGGSIALTTN